MLKPLAIGTARKAGVLKLERRSLLDEPMSKGVRLTACSALYASDLHRLLGLKTRKSMKSIKKRGQLFLVAGPSRRGPSRIRDVGRDHNALLNPWQECLLAY